jgi:ATP-dependent helicase/nuclease subunit A
MAWTTEQQQAIDSEGTNIIVSAGAGSGKTAVLTARVKRKILSGVHVNELLVLTFTNAAAAEMKDRIRKTINQTPEIKEEANLIDGAYITTFDSFSLSMVKKYHTRLNVTNNITITDEVIIDIEKHKIIDKIFDEYYLCPKQNFLKLINDFCLKDDKELKNYILNIYKKIELKYDKEKYLENYFEEELTPSKITEVVNEYLNVLKEKQKTIINLLPELNDYFDGEYVCKVEDVLSKLVNATSYNDFKDSVNYEKAPMVPRGSCEVGKTLKKTIFDIASEIKDLCIYSSIEEMQEEILSTKSNVEVIVDILKKLDKELEEYKKEEEIYNFTDIARLAIKVVEENEDIRLELTNSFNEILVDEYQDTSDTQEKFISLISKNNVYMVGDIKQSIYRFRNANPYIFKNKYDTYRDTDAGEKIDLLKNFRSRDKVLDNINLLFDLIMDDNIGGADYKASHRMVFGNTSYINEGMTPQNYDMDIITYDSKNIGRITKDEEEAFIIGNDIKKKVEEKFQVFDKDTKILRDINYSDFVILLDKSKNFDLYKKIFEYLHIPLSILKDESLKKDEDALVIKNLLRLLICIKEKRYDTEFKYTFTSISRSFLYKISDEEIYNYFINNNFKESPLYNKCLELIPSMDVMSISSYLKYILNEFNYDEKLITIGNVKSFRVRSEYFYNLCKNYESSGNTIYDFVEYLNEIFDGDYDLKFNVNTSSSNSCKIMTIHKSKGLEFPICYFAGFSSKFNTSELKEKIIFDNKYGIILPKVDGYYKDTIMKTLLKINTKKEEISEKIRLLYVAVTRAKEKMIIVLPEQEETKEVLDIVPLNEREKYISFLSIMKSIYSTLLPFIIKSDVVGNKDYLNNIKKESNNLILPNDNLKVEELSLPNTIIEETHYSKDSLHLITKEEKELMDFGTKVHETLEMLDFNNIDLSLYNLTSKMEEKIKAFINSDLMKDKLNKKMYKEYEFIYEEDNTISHGIIDLLIEDEEMTIIDYKLKNIDDINYDKQLNGYRKFISNKTNKKVNCYLYSILDEKYKEVKDV